MTLPRGCLSYCPQGEKKLVARQLGEVGPLVLYGLLLQPSTPSPLLVSSSFAFPFEQTGVVLMP